jgi:hypothetical protein
VSVNVSSNGSRVGTRENGVERVRGTTNRPNSVQVMDSDRIDDRSYRGRRRNRSPVKIRTELFDC